MPSTSHPPTKGRARAAPGRNDTTPPSSGADRAETRLNLVYRGTALRDVLDRIQDLGHHGTTTEAVATALRMYEGMLLEREKGNQIVVRERDGSLSLRLL